MERLFGDGVFAVAVLLCAATQVLCQLCEQPCSCPSPAPRCTTGVALVPDGCRCCQVCARQLGEPCTHVFPCDSQRGLQCDYSASFPGGPGECVRREDQGCELNGITYQEGQFFQPTCDNHCQCRGGGISCVPACPLVGRRPTPDCPHPQYIRLPGKCCREWVCENLENTVIQDAITAMRPSRLLPPLSRDHPPNSLVQSPPACVERSTQWSPCSQSCGLGVSTRVSNQNRACKLQMETRLCKVRPCTAIQPVRRRPSLGQRGQCQTSYTSPGPVRLVHQGCYSTRAYKLRYCGLCTDSRCCTPSHTTTDEVTFQCPSGRQLKRAVMVIHSCTCHNRCPYAPFHNPALWGYRP